METALPKWRLSRVHMAGVWLLLPLLTLAAYWPISRNGFVNFDDTQYLTHNTHVSPGLTWRGFLWAFQGGYACNWHPLTWLSHMLDCQLFGLNPAGHHFTSLALHIAVTLLLLQFLHRATGAFWRSAIVAGFFALHPLHVESVAWASERKDVLSAFFFLLTLLAYLRYVRQPTAVQSSEFKVQSSKFSRSGWYILALVLFALALMSKPMVVTLPFVLLLLDFWPLQRAGLTFPNLKTNAPRLLLEKAPFFLLSAGGSILTFAAQNYGGAVASFQTQPLSSRVANMFVSYARYAAKTFWPADLTVVYPYSQHWPIALLIGSVFFVSVVSVVALIGAKRFPYGFTGWAWFLGMLVPVIGLLQVGRQAMAERYMYLPSIGLFVSIVWAGHDFLTALKHKLQRLSPQGSTAVRFAPAVLTGIVLLPALTLCVAGTSLQVKYWRNGETLFGRALALFPHSAESLSGMGSALAGSGRDKEALPFLTEAVRLDRTLADAQFNLATVSMNLGRLEEAIPPLQALVKSLPGNTEAQINLGCAYFRSGKLPEAEACFAKAAVLEPQSPQPHYNLGTALMLQSKMDQAFAELSTAVRLDPLYVINTVKLSPHDSVLRYNIGTILLMQSHDSEGIVQLSEAVRLNPDFRDAHRNLGIALIKQGNADEAIKHFSEAVRIDPSAPDARLDLGNALLDRHRASEALEQFNAALALSPNDPKIHYRLALAQNEVHHSDEAISHCREALRLNPNFPEARQQLASLLASNPGP